MKPFSAIKSIFQPSNGKRVGFPKAGMYHYVRTDHGKARLHLRVEEDGHSLLILNANRVFHFNPTATLMAYLILEENTTAQIIAALKKHYEVSDAQAQEDYHEFEEQFSEIIQPDGACPVCDLELETLRPFSMKPSAPYRMDLAITYRCNNQCAHCYNEASRCQQELDTKQWLAVLDRVWDVNIPHVVFTGGEPTLRPDLPELIAYAEKNGQITGLNTNGRRLKDKAYLQELIDAGLDHVQITLESHAPEIHDLMVGRKGAWEETVAGVENAVNSPLYVMTNTTLLKHNSSMLSETLAFLADIRVPTIGLNALIYSGRGLNIDSGLSEDTLPELLSFARQKMQETGQRLVWYTPTQYCHFNPIDMELGVKGCTAALYNMCVEPQGDVIPCQSYYQSLGNILQQPWNSIWNHKLAVSLRERRYIPQACHSCDLLQECGGGCPLARQANAYAEPKPISAKEMEVFEI